MKDELSTVRRLTVTVAIPVFNEERTITRCLQSVVVNKLPTFISSLRVLVFDDGSTDDTPYVVEKFADRYSYVQLVKNTTNKGKYFALNELFNNVSTDLVILLDGDTSLKPDAIEKLCFPFTRDSSISLVAGLVKTKSERGQRTFIERVYTFSSSLIEEVSSRFVTYLGIAQIICLPAWIYKKLRLPATARVDLYIFLYCLQRGKIFIVKNAGYASPRRDIISSLYTSFRVTSVPKPIRDDFPRHELQLRTGFKAVILAFPRVFIKDPLGGLCWMIYKTAATMFKFTMKLQGLNVEAFVRWKVQSHKSVES